MSDEPPRSRAARAAAEEALIRVVHHYGTRPEFVLLGGLVPDLLCSTSGMSHSGTTDVDVQVNLEIATGAINAGRLEQALRNAEFEPDAQRVWRWRTEGPGGIAVIKFELLADLDDQPAGATVVFEGSDQLGAANLRGTGFAVRDIEIRELRARDGGIERRAEVNVTGLAGFLLAKTAAAYSRRKPKDWYDIAYVLLHNDAGGVDAASATVLARFGGDLDSIRPALDDLRDNFADTRSQGPIAYADEMIGNHPELDHRALLADAVTAVGEFYDSVTR
ncbi:MAG: nucleotidyl transferase AbiEii/AbiGii toxin family protein [Ilumatobacteraceae bacterium]